jgi:hypothetical protein
MSSTKDIKNLNLQEHLVDSLSFPLSIVANWSMVAMIDLNWPSTAGRSFALMSSLPHLPLLGSLGALSVDMREVGMAMK